MYDTYRKTDDRLTEEFWISSNQRQQSRCGFRDVIKIWDRPVSSKVKLITGTNLDEQLKYTKVSRCTRKTEGTCGRKAQEDASWWARVILQLTMKWYWLLPRSPYRLNSDKKNSPIRHWIQWRLRNVRERFSAVYFCVISARNTLHQ